MIWIPQPSLARCVARAGRDPQNPVSRMMLSRPGARSLLHATGAPVPGGFRSLGRLASITPDDLKNPTVIMTVGGPNGRGVLRLLPVRAGVWLDAEHDRELTFDNTQQALADLLVEHGLTDDWVAEEFPHDHGDQRAEDVRFLMFRGRLGAVCVRDHPTQTYAWFDENWERSGSGSADRGPDPVVALPEGRGQLAELAKRVSLALPIPFVQVDLYATTDGPVAYDLTPFPDWAYDLDHDLDARLGALYELSESELLDEGMDWSSVAPDPVAAMIAALPRRGRVATG